MSGASICDVTAPPSPTSTCTSNESPSPSRSPSSSSLSLSFCRTPSPFAKLMDIQSASCWSNTAKLIQSLHAKPQLNVASTTTQPAWLTPTKQMEEKEADKFQEVEWEAMSEMDCELEPESLKAVEAQDVEAQDEPLVWDGEADQVAKQQQLTKQQLEITGQSTPSASASYWSHALSTFLRLFHLPIRPINPDQSQATLSKSAPSLPAPTPNPNPSPIPSSSAQPVPHDDQAAAASECEYECEYESEYEDEYDSYSPPLSTRLKRSSKLSSLSHPPSRPSSSHLHSRLSSSSLHRYTHSSSVLKEAVQAARRKELVEGRGVERAREAMKERRKSPFEEDQQGGQRKEATKEKTVNSNININNNNNNSRSSGGKASEFFYSTHNRYNNKRMSRREHRRLQNNATTTSPVASSSSSSSPSISSYHDFQYHFYHSNLTRILSSLSPSSGYTVSGLRLCPTPSHLHTPLFSSSSSSYQLTYHGTYLENMQSICDKGLLAGGVANGIEIRNGACYGSGVYSSKTAGYSVDYASDCSTMFVCAVSMDRYEVVKGGHARRPAPARRFAVSPALLRSSHTRKARGRQGRVYQNRMKGKKRGGMGGRKKGGERACSGRASGVKEYWNIVVSESRRILPVLLMDFISTRQTSRVVAAAVVKKGKMNRREMSNERTGTMSGVMWRVMMKLKGKQDGARMLKRSSRVGLL